MGRVKTLAIVYDRPTYSCGEWVSGRIVMELKDRTEVKALKIHAKGDAYVHWTESNNSSQSVQSDDYTQQLRYFKHKYLLIGSAEGEIQGQSLSELTAAMGRVKTLVILYDHPTYSCEEWVSGRIVMEITGRTEVKALKIHAKGEAYVQWTDNSNSSDSNRSEDYPQQLRYFKHKHLLIGSESSDEVTVLQEGIHEYPFSLVLPQMPPLPSSFKGTYGHVSYWMTAKLHRPLKLRIKTKESFTVFNQVDINTPRLLEPHTAMNEKTICCWCCASGPISLKAEVERMGYVAGESIKIFVEIENHSSRKVVPKASIVKTTIFHAKTKKKTISEFIIKTKGEPVLAGQKDSRNSMVLKIPELIPTLMNCSIIQMDYSIQVTVEIPRSMGLTVDLPIVIGTIPLHSFGGPASDFNNQYGMDYSNVNHGLPEGSAVEAGFQAANKNLGYYT